VLSTGADLRSRADRWRWLVCAQITADHRDSAPDPSAWCRFRRCRIVEIGRRCL
jgi:hypothetical protein